MICFSRRLQHGRNWNVQIHRFWLQNDNRCRTYVINTPTFISLIIKPTVVNINRDQQPELRLFYSALSDFRSNSEQYTIQTNRLLVISMYFQSRFVKRKYYWRGELYLPIPGRITWRRAYAWRDRCRWNICADEGLRRLLVVVVRDSQNIVQTAFQRLLVNDKWNTAMFACGSAC